MAKVSISKLDTGFQVDVEVEKIETSIESFTYQTLEEVIAKVQEVETV